MKLSIVVISLFGMLLFSHCNSSSIDATNPPLNISSTGSEIINEEFLTSLDKMEFEPISQLEEEGLIWMREEEKLACDVSQTMYDSWGTFIFSNISQSEQKHMDAIKRLLLKYQIADPVVNNTNGEYTSEKLKTLYTKLIADGVQSLVKAYTTGATIEELDIIDLKRQINEVVDNKDINLVYNNLLQGSYNHLRAFVKNLAMQGVTYIPQYLDKATYDSIINN